MVDGLNELGDAGRLELVKIRDLEILRVPKNLFAFAIRRRPNGEIAKEDRFGERTGVIREVRPADFGLVLPNRLEPLVLMTSVVVATLFVDRSDNEFRLIFGNPRNLFAAFFMEGSAQASALGTDDEASAARVDVIEPVLLGEFGRRRLRRVVPYEFDLAAILVGFEFEGGRRARGEGVEVVSGASRDDARRVAQIGSLEDHVDVVASHVAESAGAEIPPSAPLEAMINAGPEFALGRDADPRFPIDVLESCGDLSLLFFDQILNDFFVGLFLLRLFDELLHRHGAIGALRPNRTIRPNVDFGDIADDARFILSGGFAEPVADASLVAHLRADAGLLREFLHPARFVDRSHERFLRVDVLAHLHRRGGDNRVHMVGRADRYGVKFVSHFREKFTIIGIRLRVGKFFFLTVKSVVVDVAKADDFAVISSLRDISRAFAADADARDRDALKRRRARGFKSVSRGYKETRARYCRRFDKITTCRSHVCPPAINVTDSVRSQN